MLLKYYHHDIIIKEIKDRCRLTTEGISVYGMIRCLQSFIFDAFEFFDEMALLRVKREDEFAPVKYREGSDSPKTAKELNEKYWNRQRQ